MNNFTTFLLTNGPGVYGVVGLPGTGKTTVLASIACEWPYPVYSLDYLGTFRPVGLNVRPEQTKITDYERNSLIIIDEIDSFLLEDTGARWNQVRSLLKIARNLGVYCVWSSHSLGDVPYWASKSVLKGLILGRLSRQDVRKIKTYNDDKLSKVFHLTPRKFICYPITAST